MALADSWSSWRETALVDGAARLAALPQPDTAATRHLAALAAATDPSSIFKASRLLDTALALAETLAEGRLHVRLAALDRADPLSDDYGERLADLRRDINRFGGTA